MILMLDSPTKHTPWFVFQNARRNTGSSQFLLYSREYVVFCEAFCAHVALSPTDFKTYCTALLGVLFSVRSHYLFAIGLEKCLVFAVDAREIHEGYPTPATLELTRLVLV